MDLEVGDVRLRGLAKLNVLVGKNGCGKSTLLKRIDESLQGTDRFVKYVTPERGGVLTYEAGIETNIINDARWMPNSRRVNQFANFKQQSAAQFRRLELAVLREAETTRTVPNFQPTVDQLNSLLDNIELRRVDPTFKLYDRLTENEILPVQISSGESELISLGIEVLMFVHEVRELTNSLLLLDEPDVHLHPDLQVRFAGFLSSVIDGADAVALLATHSTALLGGLSGSDQASVAFMKPRELFISFAPIDDVLRRIIPVFGAHPLSNVFNEAPVFVVEGDDDERVWQQAVRSGEGAIRLYPVACDGVSDMNTYELEVERVISSVYDAPRAFTLRDGDGNDQELEDIGSVGRLRLKCRAAENLMLTDDVLGLAGTDWSTAQRRVTAWVESNPKHSRCAIMKKFAAEGFDRRGFDLKDIRNVLVGDILESSKPWEVLVGQAIGQSFKAAPSSEPAPDTLADYLGTKVVAAVRSTAR